MAGSNARSSEETTNTREIVITRVFDAPRELVFKAWLDPGHLAQWWGPKGFTNPICEVDARPGGSWRVVMRAPDGSEYPCKGIYREIVAPERLVFSNMAEDGEGNPVLDGFTTVTFEDEGGKTKLTLRTRATALVPEAVSRLGGMDVGWSLSLDRLAARVALIAGREC